ncbi:hypothetical protein AB0C65_25250 [Nocardia sp. NPDC048505]|uniref:hypothetical protein n=1 Tax=Nocardia sp. NPDC048505 TaxID=3155756 RepID=UPI00340F3A63
MRATGTVQVDHQQFVLANPTTDTLDIEHEAALLSTGPGFLTIATGIAYGPVALTLELDDTAPAAGSINDWETVEETAIESTGSLQVLTLDGVPVEGFDPLPPGRYQVRAHARGRDRAWALEVAEPTETYWLRLWPAPGQATSTCITVLRTTDAAHSSPAKTIPQPDPTTVTVFAADGSVQRVAHDSPEATRAHDTIRNWGGRPPSNLRYAISAFGIGGLDRELVDELDALPPDTQQALARWCVRRAFEKAGVDRVPDFAEALDALDDNREPPADFGNGSLLRNRVDTDPAIALTLADGLPGSPQHVVQHMALSAYTGSTDPDPVTAMFSTLSATAATYGMAYQKLFDRIREEFLAR